MDLSRRGFLRGMAGAGGGGPGAHRAAMAQG